MPERISMNIIVAVDSNWAIGYKGNLLVRIPNDQKWFRNITTGKVVVMGRKTLSTLPGGMPLKNRTNIVITGNPDMKIKDACLATSMDELFGLLEEYEDDDVYIIGGESVYKQLLPFCKKAYVTRIDYSYQADTYFPNLSEDPLWEKVSESEEQTYFDIAYTFEVYERRTK